MTESSFEGHSASKMSALSKPVDHAERRMAVNPRHSIICAAPAGSGKTQLLTERFLHLLNAVEKPESILAMTFTRKAANEMQERIYNALKTASLQTQAPEEQHLREMWEVSRAVLKRDKQLSWNILDNPHRLQIKTFDSLCAQIANALPFSSELGATPNVSSQIEEVYRSCVRKFLLSLEDDAPWAGHIETLLAKLDSNYPRVEALLISLLARREQWLPHVLGFVEDEMLSLLQMNLLNARRDYISTVVNKIPVDLRYEWLEMADFAAEQLSQQNLESPILACANYSPSETVLPGYSDDDIACWLGLVTLLLTNDGDWRKKVDKRQGFPPGADAAQKKFFRAKKTQLLALSESFKLLPDMLEDLDGLRQLPKPSFTPEQEELLSALAQVLPVLSGYLKLSFQEHNCIDFTEISARARLALGKHDEPSDLALQLDCKIEHILVDEFQDTSHTQIQLLSQLTSGWYQGDGKTLFCVGDAMQSIYGFRGANVGLFLHIFDKGFNQIPLTPIQLRTNFRSDAGIVNWVNTVFSQAFPQSNDVGQGAVRYTSSAAFGDQDSAQCVFVQGVFVRAGVEGGDGESKGVDLQQAQHQQASQVVEIVTSTRAQKPDASIAILVRSRSHADGVIALLQKQRIPYRALDLEALKNSIAVQDLSALTHALLDTEDRISWLAVLRSPLFGLSLADLAFLTQQGTGEKTTLPSVICQAQLAFKPSAGSGLSPKGQKRLQQSLPVLETALDNRHRQSLRDWVEGVWLQLGGPACAHGAAELENANRFFEVLAGVDSNGLLASKEALALALDNLYCAPDPEANDLLQIMTIHKAKGLEFDTVIVPHLEKGSKANTAGLLNWHERVSSTGESELLMVPINAKGSERDQNIQYLNFLEKKKAKFEKNRLLYVACTRARKNLYLLATLKQDAEKAKALEAGETALKSPGADSLLSAIWDFVKPEIQSIGGQVKTDVAQEPAALLYRLPSEWKPPKLPRGQLLSEYVIPAELTMRGENNLPDLKIAPSSPRRIGTVVHAVLHDMHERGVDAWATTCIDDRVPLWRAMLRQLGEPASDIEASVKACRGTVERLLGDKHLAKMLSPENFSRSEFAVSLDTEDGATQLVIDLLSEFDEALWVVDYKITRPDLGEEASAFVQKELNKYEVIMRRYQASIASIFDRQDVKIALYFPLIQIFAEYSE